MLRATIEKSKREQLEKIKVRQQVTKQRHDQMQKEKKTKLDKKIIHARENREIELTNIKQKAKLDLQTVEYIRYIDKMTTTNLKMDIKNKLTETEERRN